MAEWAKISVTTQFEMHVFNITTNHENTCLCAESHCQFRIFAQQLQKCLNLDNY